MKNWLENPRTTLGALIVCAGIALMFLANVETGSTVIGIGAVWIGVAAGDGKKEN